MAIALKYRKSSEAAASYDYVDISSGSGYVKYYGFTTTDSGTKLYKLLNRQIVSNNAYTEDTSIVDTTESLDLDFDTSPFNLPKVINGDVFITIPHDSTGSDGDNDSGTVTVTLYKWDGTTETSLGTETTGAFTPTRNREESTFKINVSNKLIKKGEMIRLNVIYAGTEQGTGTMQIRIHHDPLESTDNPLTMDVPFKVDL